MTKSLLLLAILVVLLCSCSAEASQTMIDTAVAQTMAARITDTPVPTNTSTVTATFTITPTITPTSTETPTPTATPDVRILDISPDKYVLEQNDLPVEGKYYIPNAYWASFNTNEEIISAWGVEKGREYVIDTGRLIGFELYFKRGARDVRMPEELNSSVIVFRSPEGAMLSLNKYARANRDPDYTLIENIDGIGDICTIVERKISGSGDSEIASYILDFAYRNIVVTVYGYGLKRDLSIDFLTRLAKIELKKLQDAPLSMPPTATATP